MHFGRLRTFAVGAALAALLSLPIIGTQPFVLSSDQAAAATWKGPLSTRLLSVRDIQKPVDCTGGSITFAGGNTIHTFTSSGTLSCTSGKTATILVVAGGGAAGSGAYAGGGGGGGMCEQTSRSISGNLTVTAGAGGLGVLNAAGSVGNDSVFDTVTAKGGGFGAGTANANGGTGGSGGGGQSNTGTGNTSNQAGSGGATCFGNTGGNASGSFGGGGGGAGGAGATQTAGVGRANSITGASVTYSKGGQSGDTSDQGACVNPGDGGPIAGGVYNGGPKGHDGCNGRVFVSYPTSP